MIFRRSLARIAFAMAVLFAFIHPVHGQLESTGAGKVDDERDRAVMQRFLALLEKSPRRGTALDRVYGYHVERGTLDSLMSRYRDRVAKDSQDGTSWLLLGLLESQRGREAAAVTALRKAEAARPSDPLPSYYLGQTLVLIGQPEGAAEAFERAIARKPARSDLLEIFQALGRVHQRAQHHEKAMQVWTRLEQLFPDDLRVQEQIAEALAQDSKLALALSRYDKLAAKVTDEYRRVQLRIEAADLKVRLNRSNEALSDFEALLGKVNPDSWVGRLVRQKVEEIFLRSDDINGLARYYASWLAKNPEDVEAMARLGRALAGQGRPAEAREWLDKAVKLAPGRRELRLALVEQLVEERKYAEASAQYEAMAKADPNNADILKAWGRLLLNDESTPEAARKQAAASVWRRMVDARPGDAATAVQVADLYRQAGLTEEALALYKKAIELAPEATQYHEYLGEYYHSLKRPDDAKRAWSQIVAGRNRSPQTLSRLAEVLSGFGYKTEAVEAVAEACALAADEFVYRLQYARILHAVERFEEERKQLEIAGKLADGDTQADSVVQAQVESLISSGLLTKAADELRAALDAKQDASSPRWRRLARYYEADQRLAEATAAIRRAVALEPNSIPNQKAAAALHEQTGNFGAAADALRNLALLDRRARTEYLTQIAKLEVRLGRRDEALRAGRELLAAAPGNPEHYEFFSELCFQLGDVDEGLDALRRSVRLNPADPKLLLSLASALSRQFRTDEAIELYWRAFEKAQDLDGKLSVVSRLTDLYLQRSQFDRLVARLERAGREADRQRETAISLSVAYQEAGDFGTARQVLERQAASNPRDTGVLGQLSALAEHEGDFGAAAHFQEQVNEVTPSDEGTERLAQLLMRDGEIEAAEAAWERLAATDQSSFRRQQALDSLMGGGKYETVVRITGGMLRKHPDDWEALYREGAALAGLRRRAEAEKPFRTLLALRVDDSDQSSTGKARAKESNAGSQPMRMRPGGTAISTANPLQNRLLHVPYIRAACGLESGYGPGGHSPTWSPDDFGQARLASLAFLLALARGDGDEEKLLSELRKSSESATRADPRPRWDWFFLSELRDEATDALDAGRGLSRLLPNDPAAHWAFLHSLAGRRGAAGSRQRFNPRGQQTKNDRLAPLKDAELAEVLASFELLKKHQPDWISTRIVSSVEAELKRAGRKDELDRVYRETVAAANTPSALSRALYVAAEHGNVDDVLKLYDRAHNLGKTKTSPAQYTGWTDTHSLLRTMGFRAEAKAFSDVLRILDHQLAIALRAPPGSRPSGMHFLQSIGNQGRLRTNQTLIWLGEKTNYVQVEYPDANPYLDEGTFQVLFEAFEVYKRADLLTDLFAHLRDRAHAGPRGEHPQALLALAYLHWWNDEKDEACRHHAEACDAAGDDVALRLELAELHEKRGDVGAALATADSVEPLDQTSLLEREQQALRLSVLTGDVERARKAAERLFGLRLDSETQIQLAGQMHQLGMHELGEAVLSRVRRRAGQQSESLVSLMQQYQAQDNQELAVEVAHQVLRRSPASTVATGFGRAENSSRQQAIAILAQSGRLKELIERTEAQLKASPTSMTMLQSLVTYYAAEGKADKVRAVYERMAALHPNDAKVQIQVAQLIAAGGEYAAAAERYKAAFQKEPALLARHYQEALGAFNAAEKLDDFIGLYEKLGVNVQNDPWGIIQLAQVLLQDERADRKARGLALFRKAWKMFPLYRQAIISQLESPDIWKLAEIYDYVRDAILPGAGKAELEPWLNVESSVQGFNEGKLQTIVSRLIELASQQGKLETLEDDLEASLRVQPGWAGGRALLAIVKARRGRTTEARKILKALLADAKNPMPPFVCWITAQGTEDVAALEDLVIELYQGATKSSDDEDQNLDFNNTPSGGLFALYQRMGRTDEALALLNKFVTAEPRGHGAASGLELDSRSRFQRISSLGQSYLTLGHPVEMIRIYAKMLADGVPADLVAQWGSVAFDVMIQSSIQNGLDRIDRDTVAAAVPGLVKPADSSSASAPALDLVLLVHPRQIESGEVKSLTATVLQVARERPELLGPVRQALTPLVESRPRDFSVQIARTLLSFAEGKPDAVGASVASLTKLVDETPLEKIPNGVRANARQRADALQQVGLWVVARECWKRDATRAAGDRLGERALEAAARQIDAHWLLAILREKNTLAIERGDRNAAQDALARMLDRVFQGFADEAGSNGAKPARKPATRAAVPIDYDRLVNVIEIARLAARESMHDLSFRAIRRALRNGPPAAALGNNPGQSLPGLASMTSSGMNSMNGQFALQSGAVLSALVQLWRDEGAPAVGVYETLRDALIPESRPAEVFLLDHTVQAVAPDGSRSEVQRSMAAELAKWAVRAGRGDDLQKRVEARLAQPTASLHAQIVLAHLARERGDSELAEKVFTGLIDRLRKDSQQSTAELAARIAQPALDAGTNREQARTLIALIVKNLARQQENDLSQKLLLALARDDLQHGAVANAKTRFKELLDLHQRAADSQGGVNGQPGGDLSRAVFQRIALEYIRAGLWSDALEALALSADRPQLPEYGAFDDATLPDLLESLSSHLAARPAAERYTILRAWSLSDGELARVRVLSAFRSSDTGVPKIFGNLATLPTRADRLCTADWLIDAARSVGKLDELAAAVREADQRRASKKQREERAKKPKPQAGAANPDNNNPPKLDDFETIRILIDIGRATFAEAQAGLEKRLAQLSLKPKKSDAPRGFGQEATPQVIDWNDYLVAQAALAEPKLADLGERLARRLIEREAMNQAFNAYAPYSDPSLSTRLRFALARRAAAMAAGDTKWTIALDPGIAHWHGASHTVASGITEDDTASRPTEGIPSPGWWVQHDGALLHLGGPGDQLLAFDYPLTGRFEATVEAYVSDESSGLFGYAGLVFQPGSQSPTARMRFDGDPGQASATLWPVGRSEAVARPGRFAAGNAFNTLSIQVEPGKVRYLINRHPVYEDADPSPTSPWLLLGGENVRAAFYRNFTITGSPEIPRVVPLSHGDRLEGWVSSFYSEQQPARRNKQMETQNQFQTGVPNTTPERDWFAKEGEIHGTRRYEDGVSVLQSRLYYHRPIRAGESLAYEFFYEPESCVVHPALGRLAILLEPHGARFHWMTDGSTLSANRIKDDNVADDPACRRGTLALKPREWNTVKVTLGEQNVVLEVNGIMVLERVLESGNDRLFGFYHDRANTTARVRNVRLTGDWPSSLAAFDRRGWPLRPGVVQSSADRRARSALVGDQFNSLGAGEILRSTRSLAPVERYAALLDWVVPGDSHVDFRLAGAFGATDPPPVGSPRLEQDQRGRRTHSGGTVESPAIDLVETAAALGKLGELGDRVGRAGGPERERFALTAMIRGEQGRDIEAKSALESLMALRDADRPIISVRRDWPELIAASRAAVRPSLRAPSLALLDRLAASNGPEQAADASAPAGFNAQFIRAVQNEAIADVWTKHVQHARHQLRALQTFGNARHVGDDAVSSLWSQVTHPTAQSRGEGHPMALWLMLGDSWTHIPGHNNDSLYFNVPLRGDFEVECAISATAGREGQLVYGGLGFALKPGGQSYIVIKNGKERSENPIDPPIRDVKGWTNCRLVVNQGTYAAYLNGRKIYEEGLPDNPDPWLSIRSPAAEEGAVKGVTIKGRPTIPERLILSGTSDLAGWLADYYDEPSSGDHSAWEKRGGEIVGRAVPELRGAMVESLLYYHRPMLEDGAIEYEFFYDRARAIVHPALDRLAFLLDTDGVKVHWMTDGPYERNGIGPDNMIQEAHCRRGPATNLLRPDAWNRLKLALTGDTVALTLNGTPLYERPVEPTNQRFFGLFHYADASEARVRNVTYRGRWRTSLPR